MDYDDDDDDNLNKLKLMERKRTKEPSDYTCTFKTVVELKAAIIGINANENLEKVFVNCRSWLSDENPREISMDIQLRIFDFDLNLLRVISKAEAITPSHQFFLIHISSSTLYTVSGDEKGKIHIFDSNYNMHVCTLSGHLDVVNCAVISPTSHDFICSVSDDHTVMFWNVGQRKKCSK
jgi:WD40 repeat protein